MPIPVVAVRLRSPIRLTETRQSSRIYNKLVCSFGECSVPKQTDRGAENAGQENMIDIRVLSVEVQGRRQRWTK